MEARILGELLDLLAAWRATPKCGATILTENPVQAVRIQRSGKRPDPQKHDQRSSRMTRNIRQERASHAPHRNAA
jgi:hypothetical protein